MKRYAAFPLLPLLFCALSVILGACSDDDEPWPSYAQGLLDLPTDPSGVAAKAVFDNGDECALDQPFTSLRPDSLYRVQAIYVYEDGKVHIASCAPILSLPFKAYRPGSVKTDPLQVVAVWQTRRYVNLQLDLKGTVGGKHAFGHHKLELRENPDGSRTQESLLIHDAGADPAYYTRTVYLSLPLQPLPEGLTAGRDTLRLTVNTHEGNRHYAFPL